MSGAVYIKNFIFAALLMLSMEYREIVSVTGLGGLFQLLATKSDGAIVRSLLDKTTKFIPARVHNVTPLESIEVYTTADNVRLHEVFEKMKTSTEALPNAKKADNHTIKSYFQSVFPELDGERVYVSDMKKMLKWFELLKENDLLKFDFYTQEATEDTPDEEPAAEAIPEEKPVKKAAKKKNAAATEDADGEKPAKKTAAKKKSVKEPGEDGEEKPAKKTARKKKEE